MVQEIDNEIMDFLGDSTSNTPIDVMNFLLSRGYTEKQSKKTAYEFRYIIEMKNLG